MKKLIILCLFLILISSLNAQEFPEYYDLYLNDFVGLFSQDEINDLKNILTELEKETTAEVVVAIVNSSYPLTPQEYKTKLFDKWNIGKEDKDNGLLIIYFLNENRIEVETGYGLEGILPDSKLGRLLDENYVPYRDNNEVSIGIINFTYEISRVIIQNKDEITSEKRFFNKIDYPVNALILNILYQFLPLIIFLIILLIIYKKRKGKSRGGLIFTGFGGMYGGGFGGSSGGFGGGSSGGGGAGR